MTASTQEARRGEYERFNDAWRDQVRTDRTLPCSADLVADVIAAHVNRKTGEAWPSQARIAAKTGLSEGTVKRAIRLLERRGYLKVIPGQGRRSSRYQLLLVERAAETHLDNIASVLHYAGIPIIAIDRLHPGWQATAIDTSWRSRASTKQCAPPATPACARASATAIISSSAPTAGAGR